MIKPHVVSLLFGFGIALGNTACATTYVIEQSITGDVGDTITTDGTLGVITASNITAWSMPGFGGTEYANPFINGAMTATPTTLYLGFYENGGDFIEFGNQQDGGRVPATNYLAISTYYPGERTTDTGWSAEATVGWFSLPSFQGSTTRVLYSSATLPTEPFVIATAIAPEPNSQLLVVAALCCFGVIRVCRWRR